MLGLPPLLVLVCATVLAAQEIADQPIIPLELGWYPSLAQIASVMDVAMSVPSESGDDKAAITKELNEGLSGPALFTPTTLRELLTDFARLRGLQIVWANNGSWAVLQNDPTIIVAVETGLRDPSPAVRLQAAWRAGFFRDPRVASWLLAARGDPDPEVRCQARYVLARLLRDGFVPDIVDASALPMLEATLRETWTFTPVGMGEQENSLADLRRIAAGRRGTRSTPPPRASPPLDEGDQSYMHWPLRGNAIDQAWTERLVARLKPGRPTNVRWDIAEVIRRNPAIPARARAVAWRVVTVSSWRRLRSAFEEKYFLSPGPFPGDTCAQHLAIGQWQEAMTALWQATPDPVLSQAVAEDDRMTAVQRLHPLLAAWGSGDPDTEGHALAMLMLLGGTEAVDLLRPWLSGVEPQQHLAQVLLRRIGDGPARTQLAAHQSASPLPADLIEHLRSEPAFEDLSDPELGFLDDEDAERLSALLRRYPVSELRDAFAALQAPGQGFALRKAVLEMEKFLPLEVRMEVLERGMLDGHVQLRAIASVAYIELAGLPHAERVLALADDPHYAVRMHILDYADELIEELAERLVVRAAGDRHPQVREAALWQMEGRSWERVRVLLLRRLRDAGDANRDAVAAFLVSQAIQDELPPSPEETTELLTAAASSPDPELRAIITDVVRWSAWLGDAPTPDLQRALNDVDPLVRGRATAVALLADNQRGAPLADRLIAAGEPRSLIGFLEAPHVQTVARQRTERAANALLRALIAGEDRRLGKRAQAVVDDLDFSVEADLETAFDDWQQAGKRPTAAPPDTVPPSDF